MECLLGIGFTSTGIRRFFSASSFPQFCILFRSEIESDLTAGALHLHLKDVLVLKRLCAVASLHELHHRLIRIEERPARQECASAICVKEDNLPASFVVERHQDVGHGLPSPTAAELAQSGLVEGEDASAVRAAAILRIEPHHVSRVNEGFA